MFFHRAERPLGGFVGSEQRTVATSGKDVFPVALSFSMRLSRQLIAWRYQRDSFSQDPQRTATHSDGVTRTAATEPPLSEAQRAARRGYAAAPRISGSPPITDITDGRACVPTSGRQKEMKSFEKVSKVRWCCSEGGRAQRCFSLALIM